MAQNLVQYIVVRKDLLKSGWPTGALITQACHACVAVIHQFYDKEDTQKYLGDVDRMHKVTLEVNLFLNHCPKNIFFFLNFPTFQCYIDFRIVLFIHHGVKFKSVYPYPSYNRPRKITRSTYSYIQLFRYLNLSYKAFSTYLQKSFIWHSAYVTIIYRLIKL